MSSSCPFSPYAPYSKIFSTANCCASNKSTNSLMVFTYSLPLSALSLRSSSSVSLFRLMPLQVRCSRARLYRVYPRGCGATSSMDLTKVLACGLSPRVRGNRTRAPCEPPRMRSIPAGAGEPSFEFRLCFAVGVYPRGCGGTFGGGNLGNTIKGLSPRVRGNPWQGTDAHIRSWSIPAGAGEPQPEAVSQLSRGVYPRVCGATRAAMRT